MINPSFDQMVAGILRHTGTFMTCVYCQSSFSCDDLAFLKAPLDIPIPDPAKEEAKRKRKEEVGLTLDRF